jgi:Cu-Zn family superoxide dismutase
MRRISFLAIAVAALSGCHMFHSSPKPAATAVVRASNGDSLGVVSFVDDDGGVEIKGTLRGLTPGVHGIHLHAVGACDGVAFTSAGPHINPAGTHHGLSNPQGPHAGDLQNITADANGNASVDLDSQKGVSIASLKDADGSAIVVHATEDDQRSDPAGNSGARVACGVIR